MIGTCVEGIRKGRMAHGKGWGQSSRYRFQVERRGYDRFGNLPKGNANFAGVQHVIHHSAPQGMVGFEFVHLLCAPVVFTNGSVSSKQYGEGDIRRV